MAQETKEKLCTKCHKASEARIEDPGPSHLLSEAWNPEFPILKANKTI